MNENRLRLPRRSAWSLSQQMARQMALIVPSLFIWLLFVEVRGQETDSQANQPRQELLSRLASGDEEQRIDAITRIGALWSATTDLVELPVITALGNSLQQDSSPVVRALAARALEIIGGNQSSGQSADKAVHALIAALGTEREVAVRKAVIYALARYPQLQVTASLIPFLKDKKTELRAAVAYALAENGDLTSAQALTEVLRRSGKDEDAFARSQAARGLGRIGGRDSIDPLLEALTRDRSQEVRREAARALGRIATRQDWKVIEALRGATLSNDPYLVIAADSAISSINSRNP